MDIYVLHFLFLSPALFLKDFMPNIVLSVFGTLLYALMIISLCLLLSKLIKRAIYFLFYCWAIMQIKKINKFIIIMDKNFRLPGLDIVRSLAILFVITGHFFLNTDFFKSSYSGVNLFIQSVCLTLFWSCSTPVSFVDGLFK